MKTYLVTIRYQDECGRAHLWIICIPQAEDGSHAIVQARDYLKAHGCPEDAEVESRELEGEVMGVHHSW